MLSIVLAIAPPEAKVVLKVEHNGHKWLSFEENDQLFAIPGQRRMLTVISARFVDGQPYPLVQILNT